MTKRHFGPYAGTHGRSSLVSLFGQVDKFRVSTETGLNATVVKPENGVLVGWYLVNRTPGARFVNFYDQATEPKGGDKVDWVLTLRPDDASAAEFALQIPFFKGIAFATSRVAGEFVGIGPYDIEGVLLYA